MLQHNQSEFDLKIALIQEITTASSQDSQRIQGDIRRAREQMQQLKHVIENKNLSCIKELEPRIKQLEDKIQMYWEGVQKQNQMAWKDLEGQDGVLVQCQTFVENLQESLNKLQSKI